MKMQDRQTQQAFDAEVTTAPPASIPGPLALKRLDTGAYIALRDVIGVLDAPYLIWEASPEERAKLKEAGIVLASTAQEMQDWYATWDGPK